MSVKVPVESDDDPGGVRYPCPITAWLPYTSIPLFLFLERNNFRIYDTILPPIIKVYYLENISLCLLLFTDFFTRFLGIEETTDGVLDRLPGEGVTRMRWTGGNTVFLVLSVT